MSKRLRLLPPFLCIVFFAQAAPLHSGREALALLQFDAAKQAFNRQDYFLAAGLANLARTNSPASAAPWLLIGHCFYLEGQDQAALFHYNRALALNPHIGHLPPFLGDLRRRAALPPPPPLSPYKLWALRRKIGQMIMVSVPGTRLSGQKKALIRAGWIGGVILFNQNIRSKAQVAGYIRNMQSTAPTPLFVAVDQEGGAVRRFREAEGFRWLPSMAALGRTRNTGLAFRFGLLSGMELKEVGANMNLAPVVDLNHGIPDIITKYDRSLGADPRMVSDMALQIVRGMRAEGILATAKHFPTQSIVAANTHKETAISNVPLSELEKADLVPYRTLIQDRDLDAVMLSHIVYRNVDPYFPASLSPEMIRGVLRKQLGFQGLVISDDLRMDAIKDRYPIDVSVVQAVRAGVDILLVTDNDERRVMDAVVSAVERGRIEPSVIDDAFRRILAVKVKYGILDAARAQRLAGRVGQPEIQAAWSRPLPASAHGGPLLLAQEPPAGR